MPATAEVPAERPAAGDSARHARAAGRGDLHGRAAAAPAGSEPRPREAGAAVPPGRRTSDTWTRAATSTRRAPSTRPGGSSAAGAGRMRRRWADGLFDRVAAFDALCAAALQATAGKRRAPGPAAFLTNLGDQGPAPRARAAGGHVAAGRLLPARAGAWRWPDAPAPAAPRAHAPARSKRARTRRRPGTRAAGPAQAGATRSGTSSRRSRSRDARWRTAASPRPRRSASSTRRRPPCS